MSRTPVAKDWRKLARTARKEHWRNPKKFVYLLKQLYDVVNEGKEQRRGKGDREARRTKRVSTGRELKAA